MSATTLHAGASSSKDKGKKKTATEPFVQENAKSNEPIESSDSDSDSESESDEESVDSEADIETVEPNKKKPQVHVGNGSHASALPKYQPPTGMSPAPLTVNIKDSPFEYDRLAGSPSLQLWVIRAPLDLKTSRLSSLSVHPPTGSKGPSGSFKYKSTSYKLMPAGQTVTTKAAVDESDSRPTADLEAVEGEIRVEGGEEMSGGLRLLVPKAKQDGSLFVAPIPISRQLLLEPQVTSDALPLTDSTSRLPSSRILLNAASPSKRLQPTHLLKFRNRAYGFDTPGPARTRQLLVKLAPSPTERSSKDKKKRKSEGKSESSPRKKKSKA